MKKVPNRAASSESERDPHARGNNVVFSDLSPPGGQADSTQLIMIERNEPTHTGYYLKSMISGTLGAIGFCMFNHLIKTSKVTAYEVVYLRSLIVMLVGFAVLYLEG